MIAIACSSVLSSMASAATDGTAEASELKEVVITATRREIEVSDAPANVTVINSADLKKRKISRIGDALNEVPSIYLRGSPNGDLSPGSGMGGMTIRGVGSKSGRALMMVDGVVLNNSYTGSVNWSTVNMADAERVEVVPGSFSSLYGSSAMGGVVNVITKRPTKEEAVINADYGWGASEKTSLNATYRNKLKNGLGLVLGIGSKNNNGYPIDFALKGVSVGAGTTPVTGGIASPKFTSSTATADGFYTPAYIVGDKGNRADNGRNAHAKLFFDLTPDSYVYLGTSYDDLNVSQGMFNSTLVNAAGNTVTPPAASTSYNINGTKVLVQQSDFLASTPSFESTKRYTAGYEGKFGKDAKLKIDVSYSDLVYWYNSPTTGVSTFDAGTGKSFQNPNNNASGTMQLSLAQGTTQFWTVGLATRQEEGSKLIYSLSNWRNVDSKTKTEYDGGGKATTNSIFVQDEISVRDDLTLYVGGRYDHWASSGQATSYIAPTFSTSYSERTQSSFNPKLSAVFKPRSNATLRASWGTGFRNPTIAESYAKTVSVSNGITTTVDANATLKPERSSSWELGGEIQMSPNVLLKATYYENEIEDMVYVQTVSTTALAVNKEYNNAGQAKIKGVELGAAWKLSSWLKLTGGYSFTDARMIKNETDPGSVGKRLTQTPMQMGNMALEGSVGAWDGRIAGRFVSKTYSDEHNADTQEGIFGAYDSTFLVDAKIAYKINRDSKLSFAISNLLDRKYFAYYLMPERSFQIQLTTGF